MEFAVKSVAFCGDSGGGRVKRSGCCWGGGRVGLRWGIVDDGGIGRGVRNGRIRGVLLVEVGRWRWGRLSVVMNWRR